MGKGLLMNFNDLLWESLVLLVFGCDLSLDSMMGVIALWG